MGRLDIPGRGRRDGRRPRPEAALRRRGQVQRRQAGAHRGKGHIGLHRARVELTDDERKHNQDSGCIHEHVLFVVSGVQADQVEGGTWYCWGGIPRYVRSWKIADPDLELQPIWLYTVPPTTQAQVEVSPAPTGHEKPGPSPSESE